MLKFFTCSVLSEEIDDSDEKYLSFFKVVNTAHVSFKDGAANVFSSGHFRERRLRALLKGVNTDEEAVVDDAVLLEEVAVCFDLNH